jgi:hydroxyacylglutathione hydrolase
MVDSIGRLRSLPDNTRIWCAHEYTLSNLQFAITVEPENAALMQRFEQVKAMRSRQASGKRVEV